jgi:cytochrome c-type biogenesis protein
MKWLLAALLVLPIAGSAGSLPDVFVPLRVGQSVPAYEVRTLTGKTLRVGAPEAVTLLNIWATWCGPCRKEFPALQSLHEGYASRGLRLLAVSIDHGGEETVRSVVGRSGVTFEIGHDPAGRLSSLYKSVGVPESFLIDTDGRLLWHKVGVIGRSEGDLRAMIEAALRTKPPATPPGKRKMQE